MAFLGASAQGFHPGTLQSRKDPPQHPREDSGRGSSTSSEAQAGQGRWGPEARRSRWQIRPCRQETGEVRVGGRAILEQEWGWGTSQEGPARSGGREGRNCRRQGSVLASLPKGETAVGGGQWEYNGFLRPFPLPRCPRSTGKGVTTEPLFCAGITAALHLDLGQPSNPSRFHRWQHTERGTCPRSLSQEVVRWESNLVRNHPKPAFFSRTGNEWMGIGLVGWQSWAESNASGNPGPMGQDL